MLRQAILGLAAMVAVSAPAMGQDAIRIGEINSYSGMAAFTVPYRNGWTLAVEEVNAAGGVLGRKIEVVSRDDAGKPEDAVRLAAELVTNEKVAVLAGTFFSHIGLAVSDYARQHKVLFLGSEPLTDAMTWSKGHRYTFRLRPSTYMQSAMLAEEAAKLPAKRWATIAPNYEYGQSAVAAFKELLKARRPDVEFVAEQWPAQGKIDAGATVQAIALARPDAIFNVTFGPDLGRLVREGNTRGLFRNRPVVSLLTGEPEYLDPLKDETPEGWIVTGYPWEAIETPEHKAFRDAYRKRFDDYPRLGSVVGYGMVKSIAAAIAKAGSTDTEKMVDAMRGLSLPSPFGPMEYRAIDHQSTLGAYVGRTTVRDGKGVMVDWRYADGAKYLPDDATVRKLRPQE
ncbi:amino acid/amide ABC transporter substrate-binding protein (HAAT family) [Stella humosa]|uniref:Amino acid/amide ABC transporter substrate-binding protein (HAAT family) n=1 Tax=Stella humosa TaxID=94 RepID=A0A3N1MEH0_9PROT|nr:ABC transporter substrate-binding protein [Stella humosa]ROQ01525.1 amino acid/amide ABC transporter substrate-binding protein (HAAT family) [Stella humosa]BBK31904.1 ABC transporter substrate-binding protein [Stella humosa]